MKKTVACIAPYHSGGLGQHFSFVVEETRAANRLTAYYTPQPQRGDGAGQRVTIPLQKSLYHHTPLRWSPGWRHYVFNQLFDRAVAAQLGPADEFEAVCAGHALQSFRRARQLGYSILAMQADNSHADNVMRQHQKAQQQFGFEPSWLNCAQQRNMRRAYAMADIIHVASDYTMQTFLAAGVPAHKLRRRNFTVPSRFVPPVTRRDDGIFRVVYSGSVTVMKGVPILLEAFSRLTGQNCELTLVGGSSTRWMRQYLESWQARDPRIRLAPGDPLPHLQRANVYVHPSYEDGFAYAPMEALACGVPVIVTADTGMKEYVQDGVNGYVVPTGDWEALLERLRACQSSLSMTTGMPIMAAGVA